VTVRGGVGDILSGVLPAHLVTAVLHQANEVLAVTSQGHALVDVNFQIHLPAIALGIGAVLPVGHGAFLLLLLRLYNRKTVLHTQLIRCFPELLQGLLVAVVLETGVAAYGVDYEMGMDVIPVGVGCYYDFEAGDLLRQLQRNLMCHLRGYRIIGTEGLNHVIVHPSPGAVVKSLGVHEFLQGALRHTVYSGDQGAALVRNFGRPAAVGDGTVQTANGLGLSARRKFYDCHSYHRFRLRMSDSRELTEV